MNTKEAKKLLDRYHNQQCTPEEKAKLEAWFDQISRAGEWDWQEQDNVDFGEQLKHEIDSRLSKQQKTHPTLIKWIAVAASLLLISSWFLFTVRNQSGRTVKAEYAETYASPGQRVKLTLSDGSTVILNGASKLRYPVTFRGNTREVSLLEGEAYFDIRHDEKKTFVVEAVGTHTYVLGTAFNIRAYKLAKEVQVTVTRGKVSVSGLVHLKGANVSPIILLPNEQVTIAKQTGNMIQKHINAADYTVWVQGKYKFNNESLGNVAIVLENAFNVHITFDTGDIKNIRFSSEFDSTDKLDDLLFAICRANNLTYSINGKNVILKEKSNQ
ncbi:FecR domain-containing protein [Mucilaginibacter sp. SMC90]|uniref:FecR family protein n=1 Tax=Mucilaginibacter sp. SMC90 TaxID=2929803 RepID=UPI001FB4E141|nr:FecR domain-containing protein [Mucilaginibacter sp. SMC90]UOE47428.1 FecR domain-containing protein [Mucilaginibacter sp. SMC90]